MTQHQKNERGSYLTELAISLPLALFAVFSFVWLGSVLSARAGFSHAVARGVRLAATRAPLDTISAVSDWKVNGNDARVKELLASSDQNWLDAQSTYYSAGSTFGTGRVFSTPLGSADLPDSYTYALIYVYESLKQTVGSSLRYPCDPATEGPGCLVCTFINPDAVRENVNDPDLLFAHWDFWNDGNPQENQIGIECTYQPSGLFSNVIDGLHRYMYGNKPNPLTLVRRAGLDVVF